MLKLEWYECCLLLLTVMIFPELVSAADNTAVDNGLCNVSGMMTGKVAHFVATDAIVMTGIATFMGKTSWSTCLTICCGIALVFGVPTVIDFWNEGSAAASC